MASKLKTTNSNFLEEFNRLPQPLQDILSSSLLGQTISDALNLAQVEKERYNDLMEATSEVLMLHIAPEQFEGLLVSQYQIELKQARIISKIINSKIFSPLKPLLKKETNLIEVQSNYKESPSFVEQKLQQISSLSKKIHFPDFSKVFSKDEIEKKSPPFLKEVIKEQSKDHSEIIKKEQSPENKKQIVPKKETLNNLTTSSFSTNKKEVESKKRETLPTSEIKIPEPVEIKIEQPYQQNIEPPPITIPETPPEKQEKIKETLLKAMSSKKSETPKIVEKMEELEKNPPQSKTEKEIKKEKSSAQLSEISEVVFGKNNKFASFKKGGTSSSLQSSVLNVKIKELEKKEKELPKTNEPIAYQKHLQKEEKPFGEV